MTEIFLLRPSPEDVSQSFEEMTESYYTCTCGKILRTIEKMEQHRQLGHFDSQIRTNDAD